MELGEISTFWGIFLIPESEAKLWARVLQPKHELRGVALPWDLAVVVKTVLGSHVFFSR